MGQFEKITLVWLHPEGPRGWALRVRNKAAPFVGHHKTNLKGRIDDTGTVLNGS